MVRQLWLVAVLVFAGTAAGGAELPPGKSIRVYHVADIVAREAVHSAGPAVVDRPREELRNEHAETLAALERLAEVIELMVPSDRGAISVRPETLSLVIRRTPSEHEEIASLLNELRQESNATLELTATLLVEGDSNEPTVQAALEEIGARYVLEFGSQNGLSPTEVDHVRETMRKSGGHVFTLPTVRLRTGFRTTWGTSFCPLSVTALADADEDRVTLRIDAPVNDPANGPVKFRTSKLEVKIGHSFLYQVQAEDEDEVLYLVTIRKRGEVQTPITAEATSSVRK